MGTLNIDTEITRLLHLAIIAQMQAWEACNNLESVLDSEYGCGTPEHSAARLLLTDAVQEMASDPDQSIVETLALYDAKNLRDTLQSLWEEREQSIADARTLLLDAPEAEAASA